MKQVINSERIPIKLWLDDIESGTLQQAKDLANLSVSEKWIAIMPDAHVGYGMPIGGILATRDVVVPNAVGVDIGCGMIAAQTSLVEDLPVESIKDILHLARSVIPVGFAHQKEPQRWDGFNHAPDVPIIQRELDSARRQLGTLGGGNHFLEIQRGDDGFIWLMVHSGSRNFGLQVAEEYHRQAREFCRKHGLALPTDDLAYLPLDSSPGEEYWQAMQFCLEFATANRRLMMERLSEIFLRVTGYPVQRTVTIHHNFASREKHFGRDLIIHRKGATQAFKGQEGIIPGSMGANSYITVGLGNEESFQSCSHGAGRRMGRKAAQRSLDLAEEQRKMKGIVYDLNTRRKLDEAPDAYKDIHRVMEEQQDLAKPVVKLQPLGVIKG